MNRVRSVAPITVCLLYALYPICRIISAVCGYDFTLRNYPVFIVALAVVSVIAAVLLLSRKILLTKVQAVCSALLPPLSAINGLFLMIDSRWNASVLFALVCFGCSVLILVNFAQPRPLKIISAILSVLLVLFLLLSALILHVFVNFVNKTIVKTVTSPQNTYIAKVIDSDQGALGGNTLVDVWNCEKTVDLFLCKFSKSPIRVYTGKWGEAENMQIIWKEEHILRINSKEYEINV